ncbi:MAG: FmdB family zinc ribbon protein [Chloroflexota bacterium]
MPMYEYRCPECGAKTTVFARGYGECAAPTCSKCGSAEMVRLLSTFAYHRTLASRLEEFDTSKPRGDEFYKDSRNIGLWARKRVRELGADAETVKQIDQVVERATEKALSGKLLDEIGT